MNVAVDDYTKAVVRNDPSRVYAMLSMRCLQELSPEDVAELTEMSAAGLAATSPISNFSVEQSGDSAVVTYEFEDPIADAVTEKWVREDSGWRNDEC